MTTRFVLHGYLPTVPMVPVTTGCPLNNPYCRRKGEKRCPALTALGDRTCTLDERVPKVLPEAKKVEGT